MALDLQRHPESEGGEGLRLVAEASCPEPSRLRLRYRVTGDLGRVRLPPVAVAERADELWLHTCFEAFVKAGEGAYNEFNFAPSGRWAAYHLDGYRAGLAPAAMAEAPFVLTRRSERSFEMEVDLILPAAQRGATPGLGLSAILEHEDGGRSYWAIRHPPGKPDFHHPDSFALELPAPA